VSIATTNSHMSAQTTHYVAVLQLFVVSRIFGYHSR